ncbi:MAG: hypothetical protein GWN00_12595, partial [Aliifodinibius sp.]|nr:hypothetical protein [Phycisphaerae bacterium]NIR67024.1 hypothetical protein [candidate division Zixibacteria bacterium]NIT57031.1 hypothetical protein [Fodinibius sp.]NIW44901.1 hypothetical protein [Gammaproteobacteria bacterium]NIU16562.1 hypothetical protein [candidate division Zixibacteria bacterium]
MADSEQNEITRYDGQTGELIDKFVTSGSGGLTIQEGNLLFGPDGNLYVAGDWTKILRYDGQTGAFIDEFVSASAWVSYFVFVPEPIQLIQPNG